MAFLPSGAAAFLIWQLGRQHALPDAARGGTGEKVAVVLFADDGRRLRKAVIGKVVHSRAEWRRQLGEEAFAVTRRQATEFPFQNRYWNNERAGLYRCAGCGNALFSWRDKFDSGTGWPSFKSPLDEGNVTTRPDGSMGMNRTEVMCSECDGHLGHLFDDGPAPSGRRYCMNSAALTFIAFA